MSVMALSYRPLTLSKSTQKKSILNDLVFVAAKIFLVNLSYYGEK